MDARKDARFCRRRCRQAAFRLRRRRATHEAAERPLRFAFADPPYPGKAWMYRDQPTYAGEVDHAALIARLEAAGYAGWALSTSARALRDILPLCPPQARVCAWSKPHGAHPATYGLHNVWEPLIVVGGRQLPPGVRDHLSALPARGGGDLPGRKPLAFCAWLFDCLGMRPGDSLDDLFPGTGVVSTAWRELSVGAGGRFLSSAAARDRLSLEASGDTSGAALDDGFATAPSDAYPSLLEERREPSPGDGGYPSPTPRGDGSREDLGDASSKYSCDETEA